MPEIETYPEPVAKIYDQIMGYFDYEKSAEIIEDIVQSHWSDTVKPSILEIGIGTGALALELRALGYFVEGVDHSPAMLSRARKKGLKLLRHADVKDFNLDKNFGTIISHAGPLRVSYTPERGYFFETYLLSEEEINTAVKNVSNHLIPNGVLIMSVQTGPDRNVKLGNTPEYELLENGYVATKVTQEQGNIRIKRRELKKDGRVLVCIEHRFMVLELERFDKLALHYGLQDRGLDPTQHFKVYLKSQK